MTAKSKLREARSLAIREEELAEHFKKYHVLGPWPFDLVVHEFLGPDLGPPHDHPWGFQSLIVEGGYVEETYTVDGGRGPDREHRKGETFIVEATHIHRVVRLLDDKCWTIILPFIEDEPRRFGFWHFQNGGVWHRPIDRPEFERVEVVL